MSSTATEPQQYTRCPSCATTFRVTASQLATRGGKVRCGHCRGVFDANENAVARTPTQDETAVDESIASGASAEEPTTKDEVAVEESIPPGASAEEPAAKNDTAIEEPIAPGASAEEPMAKDESAAAEPTATVGPEAAEEIPSVQTPSAPIREEVALPAPARRALWNMLFALGIPVLVMVLVAQAVFHFRNAIASRWPESGPALTRMCEIAGCTLQPLHEIGYLSIEASDLQVDPAHKGLLILTATVRNRAPYAVAYPYLELTLTDSHDQVVVRRALAPKDYAGGTTDLDAGIAANAELAVKLFIDASASTQVGYRVYLFYP